MAKFIVSKSCSYAYKKFVKKKILFRNDLLNPIAFIGFKQTNLIGRFKSQSEGRDRNIFLKTILSSRSKQRQKYSK